MVLELVVNAIGTSMEKNLAVQNQIWNILIGNIEVNNQKDINIELYLYYKNIFNERKHLSEHDINSFLNRVSKFPQLSTEQSLECAKMYHRKRTIWSFKKYA